MKISIWYQQQGRAPERVDVAYSEWNASYLVNEYTLAFACAPGQHRYGLDQVWSGRRDQRPPLPVAGT